MIVFSIAIVWIYYSIPVSINVPAFDRNVARQAMNESNLVKVFYVALEDDGENGKAIGCGDSVIAVHKDIPATTTPLIAALSLLLNNKNSVVVSSSSVGDLSNALYSSNLKIKNIKMNEGTTTIELSGSLSLGGECDSPRIEAQLVETAMQFAKVKKAEFFINGKSLESVLSLK